MPAITRKRISEWCRESMLDDNYGKISAIMLSFDSGYTPKEIDNVIFGSREWSPEDLETRFLGKCENYCGATEGEHQFILEAYYVSADKPNDSGISRNQMRFIYTVQAETRGLRTDAATEKGLLTQMMRHNEMMTQRVMQMSELLTRASETSVNRVLERNDHLEKENREAWDIIREMGNRLMDKRGEHELKQLEYKRNSALMSQWMKFGPALLNQILGKEIFPQGTADSSLIEAIADDLDPETIQLLASRIKPELWGVLANRFTEALETKRIEEAKNEKILASNKDPEANAAGDSIVRAKVTEDE